MTPITPLTIAGLNGMKFCIPAYQRGYRWTRQEVLDLLNDLDEFNDNNGTAKYCLQPLIVKKLPDGSYEVVDGQQRLTTVFIFMKIASAEIRSATPPFALAYKTRTESERFLNALTETSASDHSNIDFHHISNARDEINGWLNRQKDKSTAITSLNTKFRNNTQFIWYEIDDHTNPITLFEKVNMGKIPLTNAELIKAMFLNRDNFGGMEQGEIDKRQIEMAMQWERMEQALHVDTFWCFLTTQDGMETRIDLLFDILAKRYNEKNEFKIPLNAGNYTTFLILNQKLKECVTTCRNDEDKKKRKQMFVEEVWKDAEGLLAVFNDWYRNLDVYHRIGWLVQKGVDVENIEQQCRGKKKSTVLEDLDKMIKESLGVIKSEIDGNNDNDDDELEYENKNNTRKRIRNLLLLFNVVSLRGSGNRFPFDKYANESWDIEHIHAIKDKLPEKKEQKRVYFKALQAEFERNSDSDNAPKLAASLKQFLDTHDGGGADNADDYDSKYESWKTDFADLLTEDNSMGNLALLNADINREYKNVTFFQKRKTILTKTKEGRFVPLCTQNVFLKLYTSEADNLARWSDSDRENYSNAITETLHAYLK
jgi:hypothetical protein